MRLLILGVAALALAGCGKEAPQVQSQTYGTDGSDRGFARLSGSSSGSPATLDERIIRALNALFGANPQVNVVNLGSARCTAGCGAGTWYLAARQYQKIGGSFQLTYSASGGDRLPPQAGTVSFSGGAFSTKAAVAGTRYSVGAYALAVVPGTDQPVGLVASYCGPYGCGYCSYPGSCVSN